MKALSLQQVCDRLGVARKTALLLVKRGKLRGYLVGRQWRFDQVDVDGFVEAQKAEASRRIERPAPPKVSSALARRATSGVTGWKGSDRYTH